MRRHGKIVMSGEARSHWEHISKGSKAVNVNMFKKRVRVKNPALSERDITTLFTKMASGPLLSDTQFGALFGMYKGVLTKSSTQ